MVYQSILPATLPLVRDSGFASGGVDARWLALLGVLVCIACFVATKLRSRRMSGASTANRRTWAARFGMASTDNPLRVVQSVRLTQRASVHVVRWGEREWLIGCTDQHLSVLDDLSGASGQQHKGPVTESPRPAEDA
ncbi:hypothetical protein BWP39_29105 [Paraburkholderia acidicola]|uniref:Uncharacterized protein n=1 Tax=Paraburkholderia acidicola TaxID=1912599 RepID=A0A2A4ETK9_9BURK|nr:flagellar biosynthetic protein FliO [Paraburkholderia acidicola]PCE23740.1 hypothetical protein BWP39_29105 [Paraburkholderia acidicola]